MVAGAQLAKDSGPAEPFVPAEPQSLEEARLNESEVEELILKQGGAELKGKRK